MNNNTKKITTMAMLSAIAYVVVVVGRIPVVLFLKYHDTGYLPLQAGHGICLDRKNWRQQSGISAQRFRMS